MFFLQTLRDWWRERSRQIFHFHDGKAWRRADPIRVVKAIESACPDYADHFATLKTDTKEIPAGALLDDMLLQQKKARDEIVRVARVVFGMVDLSDTGGTTDAEAVGVLVGFVSFMDQAARDAELFRDSPGPDAVSPPASTTEPCAASTSAGS